MISEVPLWMTDPKWTRLHIGQPMVTLGALGALDQRLSELEQDRTPTSQEETADDEGPPGTHTIGATTSEARGAVGADDERTRRVDRRDRGDAPSSGAGRKSRRVQ